jgi:CheY-like chemotaxis protein
MGTTEDAVLASGAPVGGLAAPRVLVVEDEPGIVDFVRRGLQATGFAVEVAFDGIEGERLVLSESYDAIVLDLMLPGRSGLEVLAAVRGAKSNVPVIVLTARGDIEERVAGLDAGARVELELPHFTALQPGRTPPQTPARPASALSDGERAKISH